MTANQINFARHQEDVRHNRVTEGETQRHNVQQEGIGWAGVSVQRGVLNEQIRHNLSDEEIRRTLAQHQSQYWDQMGQSAYMNAVTNAYNADTRYSELQESIRHNLILEGVEASRADSLAKQAAAALQQAETAESKRKTDRNLGYLGLAKDVLTAGAHEASSLAQSIIRSTTFKKE